MTPAHHNAVDYIEDCLDAAGLWDQPGAPFSNRLTPTASSAAADWRGSGRSR